MHNLRNVFYATVLLSVSACTERASNRGATALLNDDAAELESTSAATESESAEVPANCAELERYRIHSTLPDNTETEVTSPLRVVACVDESGEANGNLLSEIDVNKPHQMMFRYARAGETRARLGISLVTGAQPSSAGSETSTDFYVLPQDGSTVSWSWLIPLPEVVAGLGVRWTHSSWHENRHSARETFALHVGDIESQPYTHVPMATVTQSGRGEVRSGFYGNPGTLVALLQCTPRSIAGLNNLHTRTRETRQLVVNHALMSDEQKREYLALYDARLLEIRHVLLAECGVVADPDPVPSAPGYCSETEIRSLDRSINRYLPDDIQELQEYIEFARVRWPNSIPHLWQYELRIQRYRAHQAQDRNTLRYRCGIGEGAPTEGNEPTNA